MRGDCVVGEIEYLMDKYCSPNTQSSSIGWPSEERLEQIDVHSRRLEQDGIGAIAELLPNKTLMLMGYSVMEQFYSALQCLLRREGLELPVGEVRSKMSQDLRVDSGPPPPLTRAPLVAPQDFYQLLKRQQPLWMAGKRKMPPKLPQVLKSGTAGAPMRLLFERAVRMEREDVSAALLTADVLVVNWGLHYGDMDMYRRDLHAAFAMFESFAAADGKAVFFQASAVTVCAPCALVAQPTPRTRVPGDGRATFQGQRQGRSASPFTWRVGESRQIDGSHVHVCAHRRL